MTAPCRNIAQVKLDIKQILENLQQLNRHDVTPIDLQEFQNNTENLLKNLEEFPLKVIKSKIKKRKRNRNRHNRKLHNLKIKNCDSKPITETDPNKNEEQTKPPAVARDNQNKTHQHFRGIKECQRFLQTFELLEQLHLTRGQNSSETYKFALQLRQLKSIWNCLLQDKLQEQTSTEVKIQQEWNEVLFGPAEKTYFQDKPDLQDFVRKRQIWDSYIDSKYGTSIPVGWILPDSEVKEQWQPYLKPTHD